MYAPAMSLPMQSNNPKPLAVVDTSVWVAAFFHKNPRRVLDAWRSGLFCLACAPAIEDEYKTILLKIPPIRVQAREWLREMKQSDSVVWIEDLPPLDVQINDPADLKFLQCAHGAEAPVVVSLDAHLLECGPVEGITVLKPQAFLETITHPVTDVSRSPWARLQRWWSAKYND